jgi:class 3 adenylate cyclase/predicted ATPase
LKSPGVSEPTPSLTDFLKTLELERYASIFVMNDVDLRTLRALTDEELKELGLPFGPRKLLLKEVAKLNGGVALPASAARPNPSAGGATVLLTNTEERRHLTVLFCDMVGSTSKAYELDPEEQQAINRRYQDTCAAAITRYQGYVYQRQGDGIVAFFGYPLAHEGEADRAIRAGLEIIESFAQLELPDAGRLQVRIGLATGLFLVDEKDATGEATSLASRLQAIAQPGTIVVSDEVRRLAGGSFRYEDLGLRDLKGIPPTRAWLVCGPSAAASRFDAATQDGLTPLVGREQEIGTLTHCWRLAQDGSGQVVLLSGEAGIGKSRVLRELQALLESENAAILRFQCSEYDDTSAFRPTIDHLERALKFDRDKTPATRLAALKAFVVDRLGRPPEDVRYIASLLSIPFEEEFGPILLTPQQRKDHTIRVLVDLIEANVRHRPGAVLFEDAHWADPSTLDSLDVLIKRLRHLPLLLVITYRPGDFQPRWSGEGITKCRVPTLTRLQSAAMVSKLTAGKTFPTALTDRIVATSNGVALWIEELTKWSLESPNLETPGDAVAYAGSASVTIPSTLEGSLKARLDQTGPAKQIAQIGAVIGRDFSYELISAVAQMPAPALDDGLARLTRSGLAVRRGKGSKAVYVFKHALVQQAAYESLPKKKRLPELHGKIARVLEERFPTTRETQPELLAYHYTKAGEHESAVAFWLRAGERSRERYALTEARAHLENGQRLLTKIDAGSARDLYDLNLRKELAPVLVPLHGWAAPEIAELLKPAWELADRWGQDKTFLGILHGLWVHFLTVGELAESLVWANRMLETATKFHKGDLAINAHRSLLASYFWLGDLVAAARHGDIVRQTYDAEAHRHIADETNNDPLTMEGIYASHYLWMLGYPDQARTKCDKKDAHARERNHPFDLGFALTLGCHAFDYCGDPAPLLMRALDAKRVGDEHRIRLMSETMAEIVRGVALLRGGRISDSIRTLDESIGKLSATGHSIYVTYLRAVQADAMARVGDLTGALALLDKSLMRIEKQQERVHLAEVLRLKGWVLQQQGHLGDAEQHLRAAIAFAREQSARSWELRASTTLARLLLLQDRKSDAHALLQPIYDWFTEGFDTADLRDARALLAELC